MATEATKTLAEIDASLSSERAKSQTLLSARTDDRVGSGSKPLGSAVQAQENGARVSAGDDVHVSGDGGVEIKTRVDEPEISVEKSFGCPNGSAVGTDGGFLGDAKVTGGWSSTSEHERQDNPANGGGSQVVKDLADGDTTLLIGDGSDGKVEFDQNGISLVVEVHGSLNSANASGKDCVQNGGDPGEKFMKTTGSMSLMGEKGYRTAERRRKHEANHNGEENDEDGEDVGENDGGEDEGEEGEDVGDQEHEYFVGDFVWGKIKSHPWWPGQIYDPSDASERARKYNQRERLLVAYFGDGSFSWCSPSQLKPFAEDFEEMSKQSNSKSFVNAVQKALDEIVRLVELKMTCFCIPEEDRIALARPLALNAGIKQGVFVPECDLSRLSIAQHGPAELLLTVRYMGEVVSITSMLELTVLRSWLSAFYRAKGGHILAIYHEPLDIEGLEDKTRNGVPDLNDFSGPVEVPAQVPSEEDWLSSPVHPGFGQTNQSLLQKCLGISEDKLYHRRKKKSVAELMKEGIVVEPNNKKRSTVKDVTSSAKLPSTSGKEKRKSRDEALSQGGSDFASLSERRSGRRKKAETLGSPKSAENKVAKNGGDEGEEKAKKKDNVSSVENDDSDAREETEKASTPMERKKKKKDNVSSVENDDSDAKVQTEKASTPRERKKSKYLSPPFTSPKWRVRFSSSKRDLEAESVKIAKVARIGERMTRASGQLIGSTPIGSGSDETFQEKPSKELDTKVDTHTISSPQPAREDQQKIIDSVEINASTKEVLSEVRSAALNPVYLRGRNSVDMVTVFISAFRSAIYLNGSNYKMYHSGRKGSNRESFSSRHGLQGKDLNQTDPEMPESKSRRTRNEQVKSRRLKAKQAGGASKMKTIDKEIATEASAPVSLIVTFPPGFSLPSKNDLMAIFSKFGSLNETETDVLYNSYCARVVFVKSSDAEEAFKTSLKKSPFGPASVNYRLRYPSAASRACEANEKASSPAASEPCAVNEASRLLFIKQKLEMMTSMLEKSDGNTLSEMKKSNLEGEMKGLLKKVSAMAKSTSS